MDVLVKTASRIVFPFIILLGVYIASHGHLNPGGAFPSGVIIASAFVLLIIAYTERDVEHRLTRSELIDLKSVAGIIVVILILNIGYKSRLELMSTQMMLDLWSGGFTPLLNIGGMLMIVTALVMIAYLFAKEVKA